MTLLRFVLRASPGAMVFIGLMALASGGFNAGLIAVVNQALHAPDMAVLAVPFALIGMGRLLTQLASHLALIRFANNVVTTLRRELVAKILGVGLRRLEEVGGARILASLTDDVGSVTTGLLGVPHLALNLALLLGGAVYLAWLSWQVLAVMMVVVMVAAALHRRVFMSGLARLRSAREEQDRLFAHLRALTEGIKELKLHRERRAGFGASVEEVTEAVRRLNVSAETRFAVGNSVTVMLFYVVVGVLLFAMPGVSSETMSGYVLTCLFLMGPLSAVMNSVSYLARADVALRRVQSLGVSLDGLPVEASAAAGLATFESLELRGVVHAYRGEREDETFTLGPVDLTLTAGELVFVVGGNGSGKSTLAKVLTGLYAPEAGAVVVDGRVVSEDVRDGYRQLFSAVFSDFYLFETLLGLDGPDLDQRASRWLQALHLEHKVTVRDGRLSTTALSQGQRKRLALLVAYLEDRPCYVFDEWAADQDPQFKAVFYERLLPDLKARGKTVVVITHDDRWFGLADRVIKLESGRVSEALVAAGL